MPRQTAPTAFMAEKVTLSGIEKTAGEWISEKGLNWQTVYDRRRKGSSWAEALVKKKRGHAYRQSFKQQKSPH